MASLCREKWHAGRSALYEAEGGGTGGRTPSCVGAAEQDYVPDSKGTLPTYRECYASGSGKNLIRSEKRMSGWDKAARTLNRKRPNFAQVFASVLLVSILLTIPLWNSMSPAEHSPQYPVHGVRGCEAPAAFPEDTFPNRIARLADALSSSSRSIYIAEPGPSAEYYTGISQSRWFLSERPFLVVIDSSKRVRILVPTFELARAKLLSLPKGVHVEWIEWKEDQDPFAVFADETSDIGQVQLDDMVRSFVADGLRRALPGVDVKVAGNDVAEIRERKETAEVDRLRCANQLTLAAIKSTRDRLKFGMTESQTNKILVQQMTDRGLEGSEALVLFGENAALPHGSGTDRVLGKKDLILIDAGGAFGGYVADVTRTFALQGSHIPASHIAHWESVASAQKAAIALLESNSSATLASLDAAARAALPQPGLMTHRLGHGVGLEGHEAPYLVSGPLGAKQVKQGQVFSVEPGIYDVKGGVGVRLEDCYVVGEHGGEWLTGPVDAWAEL